MKFRGLLLSLTTHGLAFAGSVYWYHLGTYSYPIPMQQTPLMHFSISFRQSPSALPAIPPLPSHDKVKSSTLSTKKQLQAPSAPLSHNTESASAVSTSGDCQPFITNAPLTYPETAKRRGIEAKFLVELTITAQGNVKSAQIITENVPEVFYQSTLETLYTWRFHRSHAKETRITVPLRFEIT